jgi:hypothetical protein
MLGSHGTGSVYLASEAPPCRLEQISVSESHTTGKPKDYIELYNSGTTGCSLKGFKMDDSNNMADLTFGAVAMPAKGVWLGFQDAEASFKSGLSSKGDVIHLCDPKGGAARNAGAMETGICLDTRQRGKNRWVSKGRKRTGQQCKAACKGYKFMSLECPMPGGTFECWCGTSTRRRRPTSWHLPTAWASPPPTI